MPASLLGTKGPPCPVACCELSDCNWGPGRGAGARLSQSSVCGMMTAELQLAHRKRGQVRHGVVGTARSCRADCWPSLSCLSHSIRCHVHGLKVMVAGMQEGVPGAGPSPKTSASQGW